MMIHIVFRIEASHTIGTGHLHRCLTLVGALKQRLDCTITFLSFTLHDAFASQIQTNGFQAEDVNIQTLDDTENDGAQCVSWLKTCPQPPAWLIVDHYQWHTGQENACRPYVDNILVIDDLANRRHDCDLLLDQNYFTDAAARYAGLVPQLCELILGPTYALLKPTFATLSKQLHRNFKNARNILITFGGSDPGNNTLNILEALAKPSQEKHWRLRVIIGACHADRDSVEQLARQYPQVECLYNIKDMAQKMTEADLFIGGGGTTTWERMALGLPGVVIAIADNQEAISQALGDGHYQLYLGSKTDVTREQIAQAVTTLMGNSKLRRTLAQQGMALVDGLGADRVVDAMLQKQKQSSPKIDVDTLINDGYHENRI